MDVAQVLRDLRIPTEDTLDPCLVTIDCGRVRNYTSSAALGDQRNNVYLASALFTKGSITASSGRSTPNVERILWLPFDFDLADYLDLEKKEALWAWSQDELDQDIARLVDDIEDTFARIGLRLHRIDYTGYGVAGYIYLPEHGKERVPAIQALHKAIVGRVNAVWGGTLADPQVCDAGPRITRLPGTFNAKGETPRLVRILKFSPGVTPEDDLVSAAGATQAKPPTRLVPREGKGLDPTILDTLTAALALEWKGGNRHHMALGIGGMLAKAGVPEEQAIQIVTTMPDDEPWDREKAIKTSYERVRSGLDVRGFFSLRETLSPNLMTWLDAELDRFRAINSPPLPMRERIELVDAVPERKQDFDPLPDIAFTGWIGEWCDTMFGTSEAPAEFHWGVGMTGAGALIGRRISAKYGSDPLYPNLYTVLVGDSATAKKDTAIKRMTRLLFDGLPQSRAINHGISESRDIGSAARFVQLMASSPNHLFYISEFVSLMSNARRQGGESILTKLMEAFDTPYRIENQSIQSKSEAMFPFPTMLTGIQPEVLSDTLSGSEMHSGFANRLFFVCGNGAVRGIAEPPSVDWARANKIIEAAWDARTSYAENTAILLDDEARGRWIEWYERTFVKEGDSAEERAMQGRHHVLVRKLALIYAVMDRSNTIRSKHLEPSIAAIEWSWAQIRPLAKTWGRTIDGQIEERIKNALRRHGAMNRRDLQQRTNSRKWSGGEFKRTVEHMIANGWIAPLPDGTFVLVED